VFIAVCMKIYVMVLQAAHSYGCVKRKVEYALECVDSIEKRFKMNLSKPSTLKRNAGRCDLRGTLT